MQNVGQNVRSPLFNEKQAAQYLMRSVSSLRRDRKGNRGSKFIRIGKSIRYVQSDLDSYISSLSCRTAPEGSEVSRG
jgi:hypothetical protein